MDDTAKGLLIIIAAIALFFVCSALTQYAIQAIWG